jgi:23S rRNA (uridine2552-2'-O)-methyltransferase
MLQATILRLSTNRRWAAAQANDAFVQEARRRGYIARSAFKLLQIDDRFRILSKSDTKVAIDLGASPGGWCQVIAERASPLCQIYGVDLIDLRTSIPNANFIKGDFSNAVTQQELMSQLQGRGLVGSVDIVTSDMCPNRTGGIEDRYRIAELCHSALMCAVAVLRPGGHVVLKVLGAGSGTFYDHVRHLALQWFTTVQFFKPAASRGTSDESFLVGVRKLSGKRATTMGVLPPISGATHSQEAAPFHGYGLDDWPGQQRRGAGHGRGGGSGRRAPPR